jgi:branched-chain amino acid transport system substrate-binding protein
VFLPKVVEIKKLAGQVNDLYKKKTGNDLGGASARAFTGFRPGWRFWKRRVPQSLRIFRRRPMPSDIPGKELVVPWQGIKFATTGNEMGQNVLGSGLIGQYQKNKEGKWIWKSSIPLMFPQRI